MAFFGFFALATGATATASPTCTLAKPAMSPSGRVAVTWTAVLPLSGGTVRTAVKVPSPLSVLPEMVPPSAMRMTLLPGTSMPVASTTLTRMFTVPPVSATELGMLVTWMDAAAPAEPTEPLSVPTGVAVVSPPPAPQRPPPPVTGSAVAITGSGA